MLTLTTLRRRLLAFFSAEVVTFFSAKLTSCNKMYINYDQNYKKQQGASYLREYTQFQSLNITKQNLCVANYEML